MPWQAASKAAGLLSQLKAAFSQGDDKLDTCLQYLTQLKITMLDFASLPPAAPSAAQDEELLLAREILEYGALLAIKAIDIPSFERQVAQFETYYTDCASRLPESPRQYPILGQSLAAVGAEPNCRIPHRTRGASCTVDHVQRVHQVPSSVGAAHHGGFVQQSAIR